MMVFIDFFGILQRNLGISHRELFENCVENMVVGTETQLKENLIEIIDHDVNFINFIEKIAFFL